MVLRLALYGITVFCLTAGCLMNTALAQHYYLQKYTVNDGLADSYILKIYQDSQGFLWLGTDNGLSRFDGKEFINYGYADGLPNLWVDAIYEDRFKRLWAGTRKGIVEIRGRKCIIYPFNDDQHVSFVFEIKESENKELWAFTDKGLYRFDNRQWKKVKLYPGFENLHCRSIVETGKNRLINYGNYLVSQDSLGRYKIMSKYPLDEPWFNQLKRFNNKLYLTLPHKVLLLQQADTLSLFKHVLHKKRIGYFYCDSQNRYWINTEEDGLLISKKGSTEIITDTIPVADNLVSRIYEDRNGAIWIACLDGLLKVTEVSYKKITATQNTYLQQVWNLVNLPDHTLMVCRRGGLLQYKNDSLSALPLSYVPASTRAGIAACTTDDWCRDAMGRTWLVTREKKLFLLDHHLLKDVSYLAPDHKGYYWHITSNNVNKKVYLCTDTLLYGDEQQLQVFKNAANGQSIIKPRFIHAFSNGKVLVQVKGGRFYLIDTGNHVQEVSAAIGIPESNSELSFYAETTGKFWIAYNGGLLKFHWNIKQLPVKELQVTTQQGLPNNAVHDITTDAFNRLWAITSSGLVIIETSGAAALKPVVHRFSEESGLTGNQWLQSSLLTDADGNIWMNFSNNLYRFDPRLIQFNNTPPPVTIEDIQLNLQPTQWNAFTDSLFEYRQLPHHITLPHYLNNLSISYRAPCFSGVSGLEYSYQLDGANNDWSAAVKSNAVSYVKLPPGTYHFKVRARKSNTGWSEPALFTFIIKKPWWETWGFQFAVMALATIVLALLFRNRIQRIRRKARIGEQLRELELKALRAQMNPHFIYNALNSIQALVLDNQTEKASLYISKFGRLLRQVLNHSEHNRISLTEELQALELYIQLEQLRLNMPLQYFIRPHESLSTDEEGIPPLVLQPFAENALWHGLSRKEGEKILDIYLHINDGWLIVEITDNGIGRQQAALQKETPAHYISKGMDITQRRINEYNQGISSVDIIDLYNEHGQPAGTRIILHIKRKPLISSQAPPVDFGLS